jgi:hypothetical protein
MKKFLLRLSSAIFLLTLSGYAVAAAQRAITTTDVFLGFLLVCWIGLPALLVCALAWNWIHPFIASLRRPPPIVRTADTDLMG